MSKMIMVDGSPMKFQIWDTAGQEKVTHRSMSCALHLAALISKCRSIIAWPRCTTKAPLPLLWFMTSRGRYDRSLLTPRRYRAFGHLVLLREQNSFKTLKDWIEELKEKGPENIVICIAGNKRDLEAQREVETEAAQVSGSTPRVGPGLYGRSSSPVGLRFSWGSCCTGLRGSDWSHVHRDQREG
jgi:GTPase SAR1 family protein